MFDDWSNSWQFNGYPLGISYLWNSLDWFGHAAIVLLGIMLVNTAVVFGDRFFRFSQARRQTHSFVRDAAVALREGRWDQSIAIAARNKASHVASVVAAGLTAFVSAPRHLTDMEAVEAAQHAFQRSRRTLNAELRRGLGPLSTIAGTAPFIGLLGTVFGILNCFRGTAMEAATGRALVALGVAEALVMTAAGLSVAIPAVWCRNYLRIRVEILESEMSNAALEAITCLRCHPEWRNQLADSAAIATDLSSGLLEHPAPSFSEVSYDHQRALLLAMGCCALYTTFIFVDATYRSYRWEAAFNAPVIVPVKAEYVGGQELFSPDRRYLAVVPVLYREQEDSSGKDKTSPWVCSSGSRVALRIIPNDRVLKLEPYFCSGETRYALESTDALLSWSCAVPAIEWRNNDELVVECGDCSFDNLQAVKLNSFHRKITVIRSDGKQVDPQVVYPRPECLE